MVSGEEGGGLGYPVTGGGEGGKGEGEERGAEVGVVERGRSVELRWVWLGEGERS